jgi:hypothetical protein
MYDITTEPLDSPRHNLHHWFITMTKKLLRLHFEGIAWQTY